MDFIRRKIRGETGTNVPITNAKKSHFFTKTIVLKMKNTHEVSRKKAWKTENDGIFFLDMPVSVGPPGIKHKNYKFIFFMKATSVVFFQEGHVTHAVSCAFL